MKPALGIDLDGVVYPWHWSLYNEQVIYDNEMRDYYTFWKEHRSFKNMLWWENMIRLEHLYTNQVPSDDLLDLLKDLDKCYNIYYITNRPLEVKFATDWFMEKYEFPARERSIFVKDKVEVCKKYGIKLFIEDRVSNIYPMLKDGIYVYVVKQPWNEDFTFDSEHKMINSFMEVKGYLL